MKKIYFILMFLISIISFALGYKFLGANDVFLPKYKTVTVAIENQNAYDGLILHAGGGYYKFQENKHVLSQKITSEVNGIELFVKKGYEDKIKNIAIYNGVMMNYYTAYSNFKGLDKNHQTLCSGSTCEDYTIYSADIHNENSYFNTINAFLVSFFSGAKIFFIPYILIFVALIRSKNSTFDFLDNKFAFLLILVFAFILRINFIALLPIGDECFSISISSKFMPFSYLLTDAGNPPLYYLILRLYEYIFGLNILAYKALMVVISLCLVSALYFVLKKKFNTKTANLGAFLCSINLISIYFAQEIRSYGLQMALTPILIYVLFELLRKRKTKYYVLYTVLAILALNLHYFEALLLFSNYVFALFYFVLKKRKKDILVFTFCHIIAGVSFLPFLFKTALSKGLMDSDFNSWIEPVNINVIKKCIGFLFGSVISFVLYLIFFIKSFSGSKTLNKTKLYSIYIFWLILSVFITSCTFSHFIKPIVSPKYFCLLIPAFIMFLAIYFAKEKSKIVLIIFFIWLFFIQNPAQVPDTKKYYLNEYNVFRVAQNFLDNSKKPVYIITKLSAKFYLNTPLSIAPKNANYEFIEPCRIKNLQEELEKRIDEIFKKDKNAVIFTSLLKPDEKNTKDKTYVCYYSTSAQCCVWKIGDE